MYGEGQSDRPVGQTEIELEERAAWPVIVLTWQVKQSIWKVIGWKPSGALYETMQTDLPQESLKGQQNQLSTGSPQLTTTVEPKVYIAKQDIC